MIIREKYCYINSFINYSRYFGKELKSNWSFKGHTQNNFELVRGDYCWPPFTFVLLCFIKSPLNVIVAVK